MMSKIYLDNNATTPLDAEASAAMGECLAANFGNPSSGHSFGETARLALEEAREEVAALIAAPPSQLIFTSGGSEANCQAILSAVQARPERRKLVTSAVEHPSVLQPLRYLAARHGYQLVELAVDEAGLLDTAALEAAVDDDTALVSLMAANNETGVLWPVAELGAICRHKGVLFHCDAVQLAGKEEIAAADWPVAYLTLAAHKLHGPKGSGVLYQAPEAPVSPLVMGAGQEGGRRAGTENVAGAVGFGRACSQAGAYLAAGGREQMLALRRRLEEGILAGCPGARFNGAGAPRLANTVNVSFEHCSSAQMIQDLDERGFAVSAHAACHSGDLDPSPVLTAMAVPESYRHGTLRISLGRLNTATEVEELLAVLPTVVAHSRQGFV